MLTKTSVTLNISSTSQIAAMKDGEAKKFDLNSDGTYDLLVKINSIFSNKVDLTMSYLNEKIGATAEVAPTPTQETDTVSTSPPVQQSPEVSSSSSWTWIIVGVIVLVVVIIIYFVMKKRR